MTESEINEKLEAIIKNCNTISLPSICKRISHSNGLEYVKNRIIHLVIHSNISIDAAMAQLESELNENV